MKLALHRTHLKVDLVGKKKNKKKKQHDFISVVVVSRKVISY